MKKLLSIIFLFVFSQTLMSQVITGKVINTEGEAISSATVALYQKKDSIQIALTTADHEGRFDIKVIDKSNSYLKVSCIGYEPQKIDIISSPLMVVLKTLSLGEVTIKAEQIKKDASSEVYFITDSLRKDCANTLQLLNKLHGIKVDWATDAVKIGEHRDVPMMVEGKEMRSEHILNLNPKSIHKVEILRFPKGKYGNKPIVLNIILNPSYTGFDLSAHTKGMTNLRDEHSHNTDNGVNFTYATKKWNIYADAGFKNKRLLRATSYKQAYKDICEYSATEDYHHPNGRHTLTDWTLSAGADYKIMFQHVVSLQTWINLSKSKDQESYLDHAQEIISNNSDRYHAADITTGAFYRGRVNKRLHLSSDLTYNYYHVDEDRHYTVNTVYNNLQYKGKKNFWRWNTDARYLWSGWLSSSVGYTFTDKAYTNEGQQNNNRLFHYRESRHDAYFTAKLNPTRTFNFIVGSNFLYINESNDGLSNGNFSWMPLAKVFWHPLKLMTISADYYCDVQHPNLDQLSTVIYQRNSLLWHQGNPELQARVMHYMQYRLELKNIIQFTYLYKYSAHDITPWYRSDGSKVIETLINGDFVHQYVGLSGDYVFPHHIGVNFVTNHQWYKRRKNRHSPWRNGHTWYMDIATSWQILRHLAIISEYFLRYDIEPLLQGKQYTQNEQLMFGVNTSVLKNKLSVMLVSTIPTNVISKRNYSKINISDYQYTTWDNDKVNNSIVLLSIRYNIGKGKASKWQNRNNSELEK